MLSRVKILYLLNILHSISVYLLSNGLWMVGRPSGNFFTILVML